MDHDCRVEPIQKISSADEQEKIELALLAISGMGCSNCAIRVRNSVLSIYGVTGAYVDHTAGIAQVSYNPDFVKIDYLINAVRGAGRDGQHAYQARLLATAMAIITQQEDGTPQEDYRARRLVLSPTNEVQTICKSYENGSLLS